MNYMILWIIGGVVLLVLVYNMVGLFRFGVKTKRGTEAMQGGDLDTAERDFEKALKIARGMHKGQFDNEVIAWLNLSVLAERRKIPEEASRCAARAIKAMLGVK